MRRLLTAGLACAGLFALNQAANAGIVPLTDGDVPFFGGNKDDIKTWLLTEIVSFNVANEANLPAPTPGYVRYDNLNGTAPAITVEAGDYIIAHYGVGPNGTQGNGGGLIAYYENANETVTLTNNGLGPNGTGGISFIDVWDHTGGGGGGSVPEGGMTMAMLGMGLGGVGLFARSSKKNVA